jgi:uncharacterized protein (DUF58 family)
MTAPGRRPLLDPITTAQLAPLEFRASGIADGYMVGRHQSGRIGRALEFAGHRPYAPGDDRRRVDWRVAARHDRWVVREEREETDVPAALALDVSGSMAFGEGGRDTKARFGARLLAGLAYILIRRRESVSLDLFADRLIDPLPSSGSPEQLQRILHRLDERIPAHDTDLAGCLNAIGDRRTRRGALIVVSDFIAELDTLGPPLRRLRRRFGDVRLIQVLDPVELDVGDGGSWIWRDLESGAELKAESAALRDGYRQVMKERLASLKSLALGSGVRYTLATTDEPPARVLSRIV